MIQTWENLATDGQTEDRKTDESDYIERSPTNVNHQKSRKDYFHRFFFSFIVCLSHFMFKMLLVTEFILENIDYIWCTK